MTLPQRLRSRAEGTWWARGRRRVRPVPPARLWRCPSPLHVSQWPSPPLSPRLSSHSPLPDTNQQRWHRRPPHGRGAAAGGEAAAGRGKAAAAATAAAGTTAAKHTAACPPPRRALHGGGGHRRRAEGNAQVGQVGPPDEPLRPATPPLCHVRRHSGPPPQKLPFSSDPPQPPIAPPAPARRSHRWAARPPVRKKVGHRRGGGKVTATARRSRSPRLESAPTHRRLTWRTRGRPPADVPPSPRRRSSWRRWRRPGRRGRPWRR